MWWSRSWLCMTDHVYQVCLLEERDTLRKDNISQANEDRNTPYLARTCNKKVRNNKTRKKKTLLPQKRFLLEWWSTKLSCDNWNRKWELVSVCNESETVRVLSVRAIVEPLETKWRRLNRRVSAVIWSTPLGFIYTEKRESERDFLLWSLSLLNVNITLDSLWIHHKHTLLL